MNKTTLISLLILFFVLAGALIYRTKQPATVQIKPSPTTTNTSPTVHATQASQPSTPISAGKTPSIPLKLLSGYTIHIFASGLNNPRDLQFTPDGTLLVSSPDDNRVFALPDTNHDDVADTNKVIITGENHVHGLAFYGGKLFVADVDQVVRYNWDENTLTATKDKVLFSLPENNDHNNRTIIFDQAGQMYVSVGSTCDVCTQSPLQGGSILISDASGSTPKVYASGLRNASFLTFNPKTNDLWATEMGRDYLGNDTPPDEINIIKQYNDYGWPYCFGNKVHDDNFDPTHAHNCGNTTPSTYDIPAHSAPLGLTFINSSQFPSDWQEDLLVAYHGSWNRTTPIGYKVVHLKVNGNTVTNSEDFLTGFAPSSTPNVPGNSKNSAESRPVDLTFDKNGNLYLSDDKAGNIFIIQKSQ